MRKYLISVVLIFGFYTDLVPASENCKIPMNKQYSLAKFRPQYSSKPSQYQPNELVSNSTRIVIVCKKDIYHDAIRKVSNSQCLNGTWTPELPNCEVKRRCKAPEMVAHATSSRTLDEYITFPDGGYVKFTCHDGYSSHGNAKTTCNDGVWTPIDFKCHEIRVSGSQNSPIDQNLPPINDQDIAKEPNLCDNMIVPHGNVVKIDDEMYTYRVFCETGKRLNGNHKSFKCYAGKWIGARPDCINEGIKKHKGRCRYPFRIRKLSNMTSSDTGENINTYYIQDGTKVTQTCTNDLEVLQTECHNGQWLPSLMNCRQQRRNGVMYRIRTSGSQNSLIDQRQAKETLSVDENLTVKEQLTGIEKPFVGNPPVKEGDISMDHVNRPSDDATVNDQGIAEETNLCDNIKVPHGNVVKVDGDIYRYMVVCETGKRLNGNHKSFKCYEGNWIGARPSCITKGIKKHHGRCRYPIRIRKLSNMRSRDTGESINSYYIQDGVKVTQTCINDGEVLQTECQNGQWLPSLMNCRQQRPRNRAVYRIRAPGSQNSVIDQRKAKETLSVDENLTAKEHLTGIDKPVVVNPPVKEGDTSMDHFNRPSDNAIANDPGVAEETNLCDNIKVPHGNVVKVDGDIYRYRVVCETGKRLNGNKEAFKCYEGNWIGARPACITKGIKKHHGRCRYPIRIRKLSNMRSRDTGGSINTYYIQDGFKVTQTCINDGEVLQTECHNGQWLPSLMNCRQQRPRNRAMYRSAILSTCTIPKSEENVTYSSTHTSGTGDSESYFGGDVIKSGIKIERRCLADTTDGAPGTLTVVNLLCADGSWMPSIKPCQISISAQYRVRVRPSSNSDKLPTNIVITGSGNRRTNIKLQNYTVDPHDVREYDVTAPDVGKIRKMTYQTSNPSNQISVVFTSIYKPSVDEYYVSHQKDIHATKNNKRVCSSKFTEPIKWRPDWSKRPDYKDLQDLTDAVSCNMACVEERSFTCKASFYDTDQRCYLFIEWESDNLKSKPDALTNLYIRHGACA